MAVSNQLKNKTKILAEVFAADFWFLRNQTGAAILLISLYVLLFIMLIAVTVGGIMIIELKMSRGIADSIPAFYAADAGAEKCLYEFRREDISGFCDSVSAGLEDRFNLGSAVVSYHRTKSNEIESTGEFKGTQRKVLLEWNN